jgi:hypothetical protein
MMPDALKGDTRTGRAHRHADHRTLDPVVGMTGEAAAMSRPSGAWHERSRRQPTRGRTIRSARCPSDCAVRLAGRWLRVVRPVRVIHTKRRRHSYSGTPRTRPYRKVPCRHLPQGDRPGGKRLAIAAVFRGDACLGTGGTFQLVTRLPPLGTYAGWAAVILLLLTGLLAFAALCLLAACIAPIRFRYMSREPLLLRYTDELIRAELAPANQVRD